MGSRSTVDVQVDGVRLTVDADANVLDVCDAAGRYVPRLCYYPGIGFCGPVDSEQDGEGHAPPCGLCAVRLGDGSVVLACATAVAPGMDIATDDPGLRELRLERLASILARHPHICLSCPERDGCARDDCTYGVPLEARCCSEFGHCELGRLVGFLDGGLTLPRTAVTMARDAQVEGRIRREPGLCVGCGRCVRICSSAPEAGRALRMGVAPGDRTSGGAASSDAAERRLVALPRQGTLRASGCTFCGLCVMVCPTGAVTTPGEAGGRWLAGQREKNCPKPPVYPPESREAFTMESVETVSREPGVFKLFDGAGQVIRISGVANLRRGLTGALSDRVSSAAESFQVEIDPLYTQRESELLAQYAQEQGHLPPGNDLADDLFVDEEE